MARNDSVNKPGMHSVSYAMRFRDLIQHIVDSTLARTRPEPRFGRVKSYNRSNFTCDVLLTGDTEPIRARLSTGIQPTYSSEVNLTSDPAAGDIVKVEGKPGSYWVTQVVSGQTFLANANLGHPVIWGGSSLQIPISRFDTMSTITPPAVGSTYHLGRWNNTRSTTDGQGFLDIEIAFYFNTTQVKRYFIALATNVTNSTWLKAAPMWDSGNDNDNDFQLEIFSDTSGYELRIRRTTQGAGPTPGWYDVRQWITMDNVEKVAGSELGEQVTTEPTRFIGTLDVEHDKAMLLSPMVVAPILVSNGLTGGGTISWDGAIMGWSQPFRLGTLGLGYNMKSGYFDATQPAAGVSIPVYGNTGLTSVSSVTAGIPLSGKQSLWYIPPWGDVATTTTQFRVVDPTDKEFAVPPHWVMIAQRSDQSGTPSLKLGTGEQIDHWRAVTFLNTWVNYTGNTNREQAAYKMIDGRGVKVKGLVSNGTAANKNKAIFNLPAGYRPNKDYRFVGAMDAGFQILDVNGLSANPGDVFFPSAGVATVTGTASLDEIIFYNS